MSRDIYGPTAVEHATEQVCKRFDTFLARSYHEHNNPQRGLIIFSEGRLDKRAKVWVRGFRNLGTRWGVLNNLADIPYFAAGAENRLLQVADFVAHGLYLLYERRDPSLIKHFLHRFDQKDGVMHGLVHRRALNLDTECECPACTSRRQPSDTGSWI